jgi:putative ATP-binding cassette transporter
MTAAADATPETTGFHLDRRVAGAFLLYSGGWWRGSTARQAWLLTLGLAACIILGKVAQRGLNWWNGWFFDSLEKHDAASALTSVPVFFIIVACMAAIGVGIVYTRETLQVRWRAWLVGRLVGTWLGGHRFYHMSLDRTEPPNPEYRIADDSRWATEPLTDLAIGLLEATVGFALFVSVLWSVGGSYSIAGVSIPAYMVLVALTYGITASLLMTWVGRPLVGAVGNKNAAEGYFRFALTRTRESAESIALLKGAGAERAILGGIFQTAVDRWLRIVRQHANITWITNSVGPMNPVIPLLFASPKYFSGEISLGDVAKLTGAFVEVQVAISWVMNNYNRIAEWYASARRVMDIVDAADGVDARMARPGELAVTEGPRSLLALAAVRLDDPTGRPLIATASLEARPGTTTHVSGGSSLGKSTLVKAVAGLWPFGSGRIERPMGEMMVVPQRVYIPLGSLAEALSYPEPPGDRAALAGALEAVGLGSLVPRLDVNVRWDQELSIGDGQRLALARVLVHRPAAVVLDDAFSALDAETEARLLRLVREARPEAVIVTLDQRLPREPDGVMAHVLHRGANGAILKPA